MFIKQNRLKKKKDFEKVFKKGKTIKQDLFVFKYIENNQDSPRIGIIISKKVCSRASERNLIKRRIREIIKKEIDQLKNLDIIIIALSKISKDIPFTELEQEINKFYERIY